MFLRISPISLHFMQLKYITLLIWMPMMGNIPPDYIPLKGSARIYAEKGIINLNELRG